jgi:hypothetical protein
LFQLNVSPAGAPQTAGWGTAREETTMLDTFPDRRTAGRRLAERMAACRLQAPVVVALPRGGVPVAAEIARALPAPLDRRAALVGEWLAEPPLDR